MLDIVAWDAPQKRSYSICGGLRATWAECKGFAKLPGGAWANGRERWKSIKKCTRRRSARGAQYHRQSTCNISVHVIDSDAGRCGGRGPACRRGGRFWSSAALQEREDGVVVKQNHKIGKALKCVQAECHVVVLQRRLAAQRRGHCDRYEQHTGVLVSNALYERRAKARASTTTQAVEDHNGTQDTAALCQMPQLVQGAISKLRAPPIVKWRAVRHCVLRRPAVEAIGPVAAAPLASKHNVAVGKVARCFVLSQYPPQDLGLAVDQKRLDRCAAPHRGRSQVGTKLLPKGVANRVAALPHVHKDCVHGRHSWGGYRGKVALCAFSFPLSVRTGAAMYRPGPGRRRGVQGNYALLLLASQVMRIGIENIPPITLGILALNTAIHLNPVNFLDLPPLQAVCLNAAAVLYNAEWFRLPLSVFFHGSDTHLYYNMSSWIYKGRLLEPRLGTERMAMLIAFLTVVSSLLMVVVPFMLAAVGYEAPMHSCAVGFSGVLFGIKVVLQHSEPLESRSQIFGMAVPTRYAFWLELVVIQFLVPNASFLGHLCGIVAGLLYVTEPIASLMGYNANLLAGANNGGGGGGHGGGGGGHGGGGGNYNAQYGGLGGLLGGMFGGGNPGMRQQRFTGGGQPTGYRGYANDDGLRRRAPY
eukprot:m.196794 g.196794  ORF g.196794 m.196794 type:complete len:644 (-) comp10633_c0_seq13:154-2085(-)